MEIPRSPSPDLREQWLAWLREMAGSVAQAQAAMLVSNLAVFEFQIERQRVLCQQLKGLQAQAGGPDVLSRARGAEYSGGPLPAELTAAESQLQQRLRVYAGLLRRSRRTSGIFCRVLATSGDTYVLPAADSTPPGARISGT